MNGFVVETDVGKVLELYGRACLRTDFVKTDSEVRPLFGDC